MYDIRNKSLAGVIIVSILLLIGYFVMNTKTKPIKTTGYYSLFVSYLITHKCDAAQETFDKIKKADPDQQFPFKYKPIGSTTELTMSYNKMNEYLNMCKSNTLDDKELKILAISASKSIQGLNLEQ